MAELGENHGLFQGAHGSAPDIVGQNLASPVATVLSGATMLRWLADRHGDAALGQDATRIERAVEVVLAEGIAVPRDLGGGRQLYGDDGGYLPRFELADLRRLVVDHLGRSLDQGSNQRSTDK